MGDLSNRPIIIKRKKISGGDGHHGGAWKVAYADFVTAMMAFFLLMWLLNATTEQQRKGIADYFSPTVPVNRVSGGGDGMFGGTNIMSQENLSEDGDSPGAASPFSDDDGGATAQAADVAALDLVQETLLGLGGESIIQQEALRHVVTRLTDEGLIIEVFAREGAPLFLDGSDRPAPVLVELTEMFARVFQIVTNPVAIDAHVRGQPVVATGEPAWDMSVNRAGAVRLLLEGGELEPSRIARMTGHADREPADANLLSVRNDRIEITLLRQQP